MIVATPHVSLVLLADLVRQFADGKISYDELWNEVEVSFPSPEEPLPLRTCISGADVGVGI
jgi:hypothetical protein